MEEITELDQEQTENMGCDVVVHYSDVTPKGDLVEVAIMDQEKRKRIHLTSPDMVEMYFEVAVSEGRYNPEDSYRKLGEEVRKRFLGISISSLEETEIGGLPAHEFSFEWEDGIRHVVYIQKKRCMIRIIYDPRSEANTALLEAVTYGE